MIDVPPEQFMSGEPMDVKWEGSGLSTIPAMLRNMCDKQPDAIFLDFSGEKLSFAEVDRLSNRMAHGLAAFGVGAGDRVCSLLDNVPDAILLWFAANKLGAIHVPLNTSYRGQFLRNQIGDAGCNILIAQDSYLDRLFAIVDSLPELRTILCRGDLPSGPTPVKVTGIVSLRSNDDSPLEQSVSPHDPAIIHYTSGTTGPSKGGIWGHGYICNIGEQQRWMARLGPGDVLWTPCPLFHGSGMGATIGALASGATLAIAPRFSVSNYWPEVERSGATVVLLLSIMIPLIADAPDTDVARRCYGQIRVLYGMPLTPALKARWKERFGVQRTCSPGYGLTEASMVTLCSAYEDNIPEAANGRRIADYDVRIIDDDGNECPAGTPGEIIIRPRRPGIMFQGYWRKPEATVAAFKDLWLRTGDIGKFDDQDFFYFVDRKKDYLRRGGENISSFEVEEAFYAHPDVSEVAAHAVASELGEDDLKITVIVSQNATLTEEQLCRWSLDKLPHFAVPRYVEFRKALPRTANGKVQKHLLRSEGVTSETWDRLESDVVVRR